MLLSVNYKDFCNYYLIFGDKVKNNIIEKSDFCNIQYSTTTITLNNIILNFTLEDVLIDNYYNKYKCIFSKKNIPILKRLIQIEKEILFKYNCSKKGIYKVEQYLTQNNSIKVFSNKILHVGHYDNAKICLKISGIWENNVEYGLIYKFLIFDDIHF